MSQLTNKYLAFIEESANGANYNHVVLLGDFPNDAVALQAAVDYAATELYDSPEALVRSNTIEALPNTRFKHYSGEQVVWVQRVQAVTDEQYQFISDLGFTS